NTTSIILTKLGNPKSLQGHLSMRQYGFFWNLWVRCICRGFFISKSLAIGILPVEGSTHKLPLLLMHPASGDQGKKNHKEV
ncbi:MAG: hypothetical protein ACXVCD_07555, partial [Pseudobdellovibrionaceae bacterium]